VAPRERGEEGMGGVAVMQRWTGGNAGTGRMTGDAPTGAGAWTRDGRSRSGSGPRAQRAAT